MANKFIKESGWPQVHGETSSVEKRTNQGIWREWMPD
jgi:hypothetical protein